MIWLPGMEIDHSRNPDHRNAAASEFAKQRQAFVAAHGSHE